jgi:hypothetical protein
MSNTNCSKICICSVVSLLLLVGITATSSSISTGAIPYANKWQDRKDWTFGPISSIQNDKDGKPAWVLSGHWFTNIVNSTKEKFNQTNPAKFNAIFSMVMLNGTAMHNHMISNFSLTDIQNENHSATYKGTVTVTMKGKPVKDVPVEIKVLNNHVISISLDSAKTDNHFGNTPVFGTIFNKSEMKNMMMAGKGNMATTKMSNSSSW